MGFEFQLRCVREQDGAERDEGIGPGDEPDV
jgi:hypothetical protein